MACIGARLEGGGNMLAAISSQAGPDVAGYTAFILGRILDNPWYLY